MLVGQRLHLARISAQRGTSLLEVLATACILAILVGASVPAGRELMEAQRISAGATDFLLALQLARSEAVKRNRRVVVCKSSGAGCTSQGSWDQGWLVFEDSNNNGLLDGAEPVILRAPALTAGLRLVGNATVDAYVSFTPTGRTRSVTNALQMGTIALCKPGARSASRDIVINATGRVNLVKPGAAACA